MSCMSLVNSCMTQTGLHGNTWLPCSPLWIILSSEVQHFIWSFNWGEPERAPHRRVECSQSIYVYIYFIGASLIGASLSEPHIDELNVRNLYIMYYYICMVRPSPARRYIHCTQCAIYSGGRMKKLLRSTVYRVHNHC